jgi:hypothetical protein
MEVDGTYCINIWWDPSEGGKLSGEPVGVGGTEPILVIAFDAHRGYDLVDKVSKESDESNALSFEFDITKRLLS